MSVIKQNNSFLGVRWWAEWPPQGLFLMRFRVYKYFGFDANTGIHYFVERKTKALIGKNYNQIQHGIEHNYFKPFLIDFKAMTEWTASPQ